MKILIIPLMGILLLASFITFLDTLSSRHNDSIVGIFLPVVLFGLTLLLPVLLS